MENQIERLLRLPQVIEAVGLKRASIYLRIKDGTFPPPIQLTTRAVAWKQSAIQSWIRALPSGAP